MLSKRVLVLISCLAGVAGLGVAAIGVAPALAETAAPPADPAELEELRLAADRGDAAAQNNLGMMYYDGDGVAQNYGEAVRYFRLAADQGDAGGQFAVGRMYAEGRGVTQSDDEAARYFRLAADQGDADAQFILGLVYAEGRGVAQSDGEAYFWLSLAASERAEFAEDRDFAESLLNSSEIADVQARVAAWKAKK